MLFLILPIPITLAIRSWLLYCRHEDISWHRLKEGILPSMIFAYMISALIFMAYAAALQDRAELEYKEQRVVIQSLESSTDFKLFKKYDISGVPYYEFYVVGENSLKLERLPADEVTIHTIGFLQKPEYSIQFERKQRTKYSCPADWALSEKPGGLYLPTGYTIETVEESKELEDNVL